jgi:hypothetical protein
MKTAEEQLEFGRKIRELRNVAEQGSLADFVHSWKLKVEDLPYVVELESQFFKLPDLLSYSLHPKFRGERLSKLQKTKVSDFLLSWFGTKKQMEGYRHYLDFLSCRKEFTRNEYLESLDADLYWEHMRNFSESLTNTALIFLQLPAATAKKASINFKAYDGFTIEEQEKALFIYNSLNA